MEYIEKGKYELLMALRNNESAEVIEFLKKYYDDMIKIASLTYKNDLIHKDDVKNVKYILNFYEESDKNIFFFSNQKNLLEFYEKNKSKKITVTEIHDIDPENIFRPNIEEDIDIWLQRNKNKKI